MQTRPEFSITLVQEKIINKLYEKGYMDDITKKECIGKTKNTGLVLTRHTMNKFIFNFLNQ